MFFFKVVGNLILFFFFRGPFHLPSVEFILSSLDLNFSNSNEEMVKEITTDDQIIVEAKINYVNTWEYFTLVELKEKNVQSINANIGVQDILMNKHFCEVELVTHVRVFFVLKIHVQLWLCKPN
jgi:hypothetical protein